jgi:hypothetical protein
MEEQTSDAQFQLPLWARISFSALALIVAAEALFTHGLRNWTWIESLAIAGIVVLPNNRDLFDRKLAWPLRVLILLWIAAFVTWAWHVWGWIPASCFAVVAIFAPTRERHWRPRSLIFYSAISIGVVWLLRQSNEWIPVLCVIAAIALSHHERDGRRTLGKLLWRPASAIWLSAAALSLFWVLKETTFWHVAAFTIIAVLWSATILLHLSSAEDRLALSHPKS